MVKKVRFPQSEIFYSTLNGAIRDHTWLMAIGFILCHKGPYHKGPYMTIQRNMGLYRTLWDHIGPFETIWGHMSLWVNFQFIEMLTLLKNYFGQGTSTIDTCQYFPSIQVWPFFFGQCPKFRNFFFDGFPNWVLYSARILESHCLQ